MKKLYSTILFVLALSLVLAFSQPALAQAPSETPTPEPTATAEPGPIYDPAHIEEMEREFGNASKEYEQEQELAAMASDPPLPESVNLSGLLPPIQLQQSQDCAYWSWMYYYKTYQIAHNTGVAPTSSLRWFSPSFGYNLLRAGESCDSGAYMSDPAIVLRDFGALSWREFPHTTDCTKQPTPEQLAAASKNRSVKIRLLYGKLREASIPLLKTKLSTGDPFVTGLFIDEEFQNYACEGTIHGNILYMGITHSVTVVGYDDKRDGGGAFLVANSYGKNWGCNGYGWISYDALKNNGFEAYDMKSLNNQVYIPAAMKQ